MTDSNKISSADNVIIEFTYPQLYTGKEWYVGFNAYDPARGKMRRKKFKLNHISRAADRRKYANLLIGRLISKLGQGWNPWIQKESQENYRTIEEVFASYRAYLAKLLADDSLRKPTVRSYLSRLNMLEKWNAQRPVPIKYIYQFDRQFVSDFLNYVYIELDNTVCTHNHYLVWLGNLSGWLVEKLYLTSKPTDGMKTIRRQKEKSRTVLSDKDMARLGDYLKEHNRHYLLACYMIYYMLLRPKELSMLRIQDISLSKQTIYVSAEVSKNRSSGVVTIPEKVIHLMLDLNIFSFPPDYYIFSNEFRPGSEYRHSKQFGDYWVYHVKRNLKFPDSYKFYSLKDTGITNMLHNCDVLSVRDQARHSDISITNIYAAKNDKLADKRLTTYEDDLF